MANPGSKISIQYPAKLVMDAWLIKNALQKWRDIIRKSRLDSDPYPVASSLKPASTRSQGARQRERVRLSDKNMYKPIEPEEQVFEDDSSSEMDTEDTRERPLVTHVHEDVHSPDPLHFMQPDHDSLTGEPAGGTTTATTDHETGSLTDPPGRPATDSVDSSHE